MGIEPDKIVNYSLHAIRCEFCTDTTKFRIAYRPKKYERYACDQHERKLRDLVKLDGYAYEDITISRSLAGPYLMKDRIWKW